MELNDEDFLKWIKEEMENQNEVTLRYKDFAFVMQPSGQSIEVYSCGKTLANYNSFDEFINNFLVKGRSFISVLNELNFDD